MQSTIITHECEMLTRIGHDGADAYHVWLSQGHTGTPEDYIAWLRQPAVDSAANADKIAAEAEQRVNDAMGDANAVIEQTGVALGDAGALISSLTEFNISANDAEVIRAQGEIERVNAEQERLTAETSRSTAETARIAAEDNRVTAEQGRATAETARVKAEELRVSAETKRQTDTAQAIDGCNSAAANADSKKSAYETAVAGGYPGTEIDFNTQMANAYMTTIEDASDCSGGRQALQIGHYHCAHTLQCSGFGAGNAHNLCCGNCRADVYVSG